MPSHQKPSCAELRDQLNHPKWQVRNLAVKACGQSQDPETLQLLVEVIQDQRPSAWWRRMLGDPYYQVGFTRRNAWMALGQRQCTWQKILPLLSYSLNDPYYEVRSALWKTLALCSQNENISSKDWDPELRQQLKTTWIAESHFEIVMAGLEAAPHLLTPDELLALGSGIQKNRHWRVRGAYLEALQRLVTMNLCSPESIAKHIENFNYRSDYFRPIFSLKEVGAELTTTIHEKSTESKS